MANETPNNKYKTPVAGTTNWHLPLNANFENLEVDVEIRDVSANRSTYTYHEGAKFLATDTGDVSLADGSAWSTVGRIPLYGTGSGGQVFAHDGTNIGWMEPGGFGIATESWVQSTAKAADSELLDGVDSGNYARTDQMETFTAGVDIRGGATFDTPISTQGVNVPSGDVIVDSGEVVVGTDTSSTSPSLDFRAESGVDRGINFTKAGSTEWAFTAQGGGSVTMWDAESSHVTISIEHTGNFRVPNGKIEDMDGQLATEDYVSNLSVEAINDIGDVSVASPDPGQVLEYDGSMWVAGTDDSGSSGVSSGEPNTWTAEQTFSAPTVHNGEYTKFGRDGTKNWTIRQPPSTDADAGHIQFLPSTTVDAEDWDEAATIDFLPSGIVDAPRLQVTGDDVATEAWVESKNYALSSHSHDFTYALINHDHDGRYYTQAQADSNFAAAGHLHDTRYYTQTEVDSAFATAGHNHDTEYAPAGHTHDGRYYTESEVDNFISGKSDTSHTHDGRYLRANADSKGSGNLYLDNHGVGGTIGTLALAIGDPDTGLTSATENVLNVQTGGVTAMEVNASQVVDFSNVPTVAGSNLARESWVSSNFADDGHTHDGRYYTKGESNDNFIQNGEGGEYEIQVNGNDGNGIINFHT